MSEEILTKPSPLVFFVDSHESDVFWPKHSCHTNENIQAKVLSNIPYFDMSNEISQHKNSSIVQNVSDETKYPQLNLQDEGYTKIIKKLKKKNLVDDLGDNNEEIAQILQNNSNDDAKTNDATNAKNSDIARNKTKVQTKDQPKKRKYTRRKK